MTERVTLQEAARRLGVSVRTVQRRVRAGELQAEHVATARGDRVVVLLDVATTESEAPMTGGDSDAAALLAEVRAERDWLRGRVDSLQETVNRLTVLLAQAQEIAQLPPAARGRSDSGHDSDAPPSRRSDAPASHAPQSRQERRRPSLLERAARWLSGQ